MINLDTNNLYFFLNLLAEILLVVNFQFHYAAYNPLVMSVPMRGITTLDNDTEYFYIHVYVIGRRFIFNSNSRMITVINSDVL